ncbi:hypothetical protein K458DRAFT_404297 [Lentithecium fluviatile CBS 122367]|uniref:Uncharacterized protein n=1 Tax=Lentithecium fluviatile CBS 122367 TaxID=1168545 RepID=A0A6G1J193_9PLEO|nr:hypothetical protein K458DRAFT_404297 [Lentithecium fluviatile CBS 122367]
MSSKHHIPFPRTFLSLNTPVKKKASDDIVLSASPESELSSHGFLSNRPTPMPRHSSISSVGSVDSVTSSTSSPPAASAPTSPVLDRAVPAFLALNTKSPPPPPPAKAVNVDTAGFLSNRH